MDKKIQHHFNYLSMCSKCKRVRFGKEWIEIECYILSESIQDVEGISHDICPKCCLELYGPEICEQALSNISNRSQTGNIEQK